MAEFVVDESAVTEFSKELAPLAHHIFPDGCPQKRLDPVWMIQSSRAPISSRDAAQALENIKRYAVNNALTELEMEALLTIGCQMLGSQTRSPLTTDPKYFRALLHCCIPEGVIPPEAIGKLVASANKQSCPALARAAAVDFLSLAVSVPSTKVQSVLESLYHFIFQWTVRQDASNKVIISGVGLLLRLTRRHHINLFRAKRLRDQWLRQASNTKPARAVAALLLHFSSHSRSEFKFTEGLGKINAEVFLRFPDKKWEQEFRGECFDLEKSTKRARPRHDRVSIVLRELQARLDGKDHLVHSDPLERQEFQHIYLIDLQKESTYLGNVLPHMIQEKWLGPLLDEDYELPHGGVKVHSVQGETSNSVTNESRLRLLLNLGRFSRHSDSLPPAIEAFIASKVVPHWDGTEKIGFVLCYELIPALPACGFPDIYKRVFQHLERLFLFGNPQLQRLIISGAVAGLLRRWDQLDWSEFDPENTPEVSSFKLKTLQEIIHWTDDLLLRGFLSNGGHMTLQSSTVDFFMAVTQLAKSNALLVTPSPSLTYRLLLSSSAVHVNAVCELLIQYKEALELLGVRERKNSFPDSKEQVKTFNCLVWDFCTVLWRENVLKSSELSKMSILFKFFPWATPSVLRQLGNVLPSALGIFDGVAFFGYYLVFSRDMGLDPCAAPNPKLRAEYLDYLQGHMGFEGLQMFLSTFISKLASRTKKQLTS